MDSLKSSCNLTQTSHPRNLEKIFYLNLQQLINRSNRRERELEIIMQMKGVCLTMICFRQNCPNLFYLFSIL